MIRRTSCHWKKIFILLCLLSWAVPATGDSFDALPTRDWNLHNLKRIEAEPAKVQLTFAVLGDSRGNPEIFDGLLQQINRDSSLAFVIHVGDMVQVGGVESFRIFLDEVRQNLSKPLLTVIGNHELDQDKSPQLYYDIFGPGHYSFHLNGIYFIMVNDVGGAAASSSELRWLEEELQKSLSFKARLVFLHIPTFDPRGGENHHALNAESGYRLAALFRRYRVTHVFAGHIHGYFTAQWDGIPYTITAGAGAKLYGTDPHHYFFHYLEVTIEGDTVRTRIKPYAVEGIHSHDR